LLDRSQGVGSGLCRDQRLSLQRLLDLTQAARCRTAGPAGIRRRLKNSSSGCAAFGRPDRAPKRSWPESPAFASTLGRCCPSELSRPAPSGQRTRLRYIGEDKAAESRFESLNVERDALLACAIKLLISLIRSSWPTTLLGRLVRFLALLISICPDFRGSGSDC
jgi:hypothetical protein